MGAPKGNPIVWLGRTIRVSAKTRTSIQGKDEMVFFAVEVTKLRGEDASNKKDRKEEEKFGGMEGRDAQRV
ncbi:hypothetical protein NF27_IC00030 [Candidatus Jidaibacter acanthamoeba]|uniref:Uncharacterized protein n=1 Tax=Candidatus Jidaibacter acanthamoebae TaxID=86105 RepID=A0A0C1QWJ4_9RICK|nr:hypothetical protein [Candidatus Jidaibacter acanthamoeba]KIE04385.1 hypothetical protein NF27_IC00030 [Candidatus Jidaibacter acanthamoeba]